MFFRFAPPFSRPDPESPKEGGGWIISAVVYYLPTAYSLTPYSLLPYSLTPYSLTPYFQMGKLFRYQSLTLPLMIPITFKP